MIIIKHEKKSKSIQLSSLMLNFFLIIILTFFFGLNVSNAQEFESDLILVKNNISAGKFIEVELVLNKIIEIDPSYVSAHILFSKLWLMTAEMKKLNEIVNFAVGIDEDLRPRWGDLNYIRKKIQVGTPNEKKQKYAFAEDIFSYLIQIYPAYPELHYYLGFAKYKQKDYNEAIDNFNKALDLSPDYLNAQEDFASIKKRNKDINYF